MNEVNTLIQNVEKALWALQEYFNNQPNEEGYTGSCGNEGSLKTYQMRVAFAEKFPAKFININKISKDDFSYFHGQYFTTNMRLLRFGQAFCNNFKIHDPDLYYQTEMEKSIQIIYNKYIKEE